MKIASRLAPALLTVLATAMPTASSAQTIDTFTTACNANPDFFASVAEGLDSNPEGLGRLCGCLATAFADYPEADLVMLTHDVEGTATAEERTAYGDYTALELKAVDVLKGCLVAEGLTTATEPVSPNTPADMTKFSEACMNSELILQSIGGTPEEATPLRTTLCQCLTTTLGPQVSTADADVLAQDLDGTATDESRNAHAGYQALTEVAGTAFNGCLATLRPAQ
jgi:hypothetical protein